MSLKSYASSSSSVFESKNGKVLRDEIKKTELTPKGGYTIYENGLTGDVIEIPLPPAKAMSGFRPMGVPRSSHITHAMPVPASPPSMIMLPTSSPMMPRSSTRSPSMLMMPSMPRSPSMLMMPSMPRSPSMLMMPSSSNGSSSPRSLLIRSPSVDLSTMLSTGSGSLAPFIGSGGGPLQRSNAFHHTVRPLNQVNLGVGNQEENLYDLWMI